MRIKKVIFAILALLLFFLSGVDGAMDGTPTEYSDAVPFINASPSGGITLISPNGGEDLAAGSSFYINWTWSGNIDNVRIEYTTDNGSTWTTITSSTDNKGYYSWNIPNNSSTGCKVRISDAADRSTYDESDSVFTIKLTSSKIITVLSPNGGENLAVNSSYNITWTSTGISGNVIIEYSTNGVTDWISIDSSAPNNGNYSWNVPGTLSSTCRVRISDAADSDVNDWSDSVFSIVSNTTKPTVTTNNISSITSNSAAGGGNVISDGGASVTSRGVCWNTSSNPTVNNFNTPSGIGIGGFTSQIPGLTPGTTYYVRAYATNSNGTSYGTEKSFTTLSVPPNTYILNVISTPETGVSITVSVNDINGEGNGTTNFTRIYNADPVQEVTLTAPETYNGKSFLKWKVDNVDKIDRTIPVTMDQNHTAEAVYQAANTYTLYVRSTPETGVSITVSPNDNNGKGNGTTYFTRIYNAGQEVTLKTPAAFNGKNFLKWKVNDVDKTGQTITVTMNKNYTALAIYREDTYNLIVQSSLDLDINVPITVSHNDNYGNGDGETEFIRTYDYGTIVTLTAPETYNGKNFIKWFTHEGANNNRTINITMDKNHTVQAVYDSPNYTLSVESSPDPGISITVAPVDNNGEGNGITGFTRAYTSGTIVTLTAPSSFGGRDFLKWTVDGIGYSNRTIQVTMEGNRTAAAYYETPRPPLIGVSRTELNLVYIIDNKVQPVETFTIFNSGGGTLNWTVTTEISRFTLYPVPTSGTNCGVVGLVVDTKGLSPGKYDGPLYISAPLADNSPMEIKVKLWVKSISNPPFGDFSTPIDGSTVRSSIPVTGWALGDTGMESVKIYRGDVNNMVYIGDANFVEGARPDVESAYPDYPMNHKAGWGYMMLTNFLPNGGNGTFKIHAVATDMGGQTVTLGTKTIFVDNANAVKPFGALDTPGQGGEASGSRYVNWGWVLTPQPNSIPTDGSTINVFVDSVNMGHPNYNVYRKDIEELFPSYANSDGAAGYFYLDTAVYEDGVHTIHWTATDSAGNTDGIGSRYFTIQNACGTGQNAHLAGNLAGSLPFSSLSEIPNNHFNPVGIKKGTLQHTSLEIIYPDDKSLINLETRELEPIVIYLENMYPYNDNDPGKHHKQQFSNPSLFLGFLAVDDQLKPLPIGSTLDKEKGIFYWLPGPGFSGEYRLTFIETRPDGEIGKIDISVKIVPRFTGK